MKNPYKNIRLFTLLAAMVAMVGCSNDDNKLNQGELSFEITSSDFECVSGQEHVVSVPAEGQIYSFMVDASDATSWTVTLEGGAWVTVNPVAKQNGSGEIIIMASENSYNENHRSALVSITNTANEDVYTYRFNQEYDTEYIRPEYNYYTYMIGGGEQDMTFKVENIGLSGNVALDIANENDELDMKEYSIRYETECEVLKSTHYSDLKYENNTLSVTFNKSYISQLSSTKDYMLPVTFMQDETAVRRIWIIVNTKSSGGAPMGDELPEIKITNDMLFASSQRWSQDHTRIADGDITTIFQTIWNSGINPHYDSEYGVYIDVNLPDNQYKYITFNYITGTNNNNVPSHIKIYAGESKSNLVLLGEYLRENDNLPTGKSTWFRERADLPVYALNGMQVKVFRISFIRSYDALNHQKENEPMTDESHNVAPNINLTHPAVTIGELKLYGL